MGAETDTVGHLGTGGKGWEEGGKITRERKKQQQLSRDKLYSKRQNRASHNYKGS